MSKQHVSAPFNITLSLVFLLIGVVFFALMIGIVPHHRHVLQRQRLALCETIAFNSTLAIQRRDRPLLEQILGAAVQRNPVLRQAELIKLDGEILHREGELSAADTNAADLVSVPIAINAEPWGSIQLRFFPLEQRGILNNPLVRFFLVTLSASFLVMFIYLSRVLQYLDPSRVIPERVRTTLDTLAEGLVIVDSDERIVLANRAFAQHFQQEPGHLIGQNIRSIEWNMPEGEYPWTQAIRDREVITASVLRIADSADEARTFRVNSAPIIAEDGTCQGALTSFDDVTALEKRTVALTQMLERLKTSRDKIRRQNEELHVLATRDPLTTALNRRSFFDQANTIWEEALRDGQPLSCALLDIDHFKTVNDNHGHAIGDYVLRTTVSLLHELARPGDVICRYGGEEFCIVFPHTTVDEAADLCEQYRRRIQRHDFQGIDVTVSLGTSGTENNADDMHKLIDQADQALYWAKRTGRNRVGEYDKLPDDFDFSQDARESDHESCHQSSPPIPFQTVASLLSALAYRDIGTAEHSRRVADTCVRMAEGLMSCSDAYVLENAALLHDIGKIGVPDDILLKPAPLTDAEWKVMRCHDEISVEIIRSTFVCDELTEIISTHHSWFGGNDKYPELPVGTQIPLSARILTIADSYDAMTSDRVYRKGMSQQEAFDELRNCAGTQFDPHLVERFIALIGRDSDNASPLQSVTDKQSALRLGQEIENLAKAIDNRDDESLRKLAVRVRETADHYHIEPIRDLADELYDAIGTDNDDWLNTLELTIELMELCRQTQRVHLSTRAAIDAYLRNSGTPPESLADPVKFIAANKQTTE